MNFKDFFNNLTKYNNDFNFSILNNKTDNTSYSPTPEKDYKVFTNVKENLD